MKKETLNSGCPFGFLSTKHFSGAADAPNMKQARATNTVIRKILNEFLERLHGSGRKWQRVSLEAFSSIAQSSSTIHSNTPASFEEVFPIPETRCAEAILSKLQESDNPLIRSILTIHEHMYERLGSHRKAATETLKIFRALLEDQPKLLDEFTKRSKLDLTSFDLQGLDQKQGRDADISLGIKISGSLHEDLIAYQNIQERLESTAQIQAVNDLMERRPDLMEDILGIQQALCLEIQTQVQQNPEMLKYTRAFSEIVLFPVDGAFYFFPSSRFLKITLHNWGAYFLEAENEPNMEVLNHAIRRAVEDNVYLQNIFVFRKDGNDITLHGIKPVVCPANEAVGEMVSHFAASLTPPSPEQDIDVTNEGVRYG